MNQLLTCEFPLPLPDLATPLGRHAFGSANQELNRLLLFHEHPDALQIDFEEIDPQEQRPELQNKIPMRMPDGIEPRFMCTKTAEGGYEIEAAVPFSLKTKQYIGACTAELTIDYPNKPRSMMGRMRLRRLARTFVLAEDRSKHPIRSAQKTATLTLRDFSDTLVNLRNGAVLEGYTYSWTRTPPSEK